MTMVESNELCHDDAQDGVWLCTRAGNEPLRSFRFQNHGEGTKCLLIDSERLEGPLYLFLNFAKVSLQL